MSLTLNQVVKSLNNIAVNHPQINHFFFGEEWDFATSGVVNCPAMIVTLEPTDVGTSTISYNMKIYIGDLVQKDLSNKTEVLSDTMLIALDIIAILKSPAYNWSFDGTSTLSDFEDSFDCELYGHYFNIKLKVSAPSDRCAVPGSQLFDIITEQTPVPILFCNKVEDCLGISDNGSANKFLNEKGDWIVVESSTLTCNNLSSCQTIIDINASLNNKVDKITGKGLSTEDYTTAEKSKLASITEIFTTALKNAYDSAVSWISTNGTNLINHLSNTSNPHSVTATQVDALKRDGSNANSDIDINTYMMNAKAFHVKGTAGSGHIGFKHQASNITAVANESSLGADSSGNPQWKNDGNAVDNLELQSNKTSTVIGNETSIVKYLTVKGVYDWVLSLGYLVASTASSTYQTLANLSTDLTASATKYPSVNAVNTGLSNKVDKNASITGATKTKITYDSKGLVTSGADATTSDIADSASARYVTDSQILAWNAMIGGSIFQSVWNATTNSPTLVSSLGTKGYYYIVSVAGSTNLDGITDWKVGDWAIFDGTVWRKVDNTDAVSSVNSLTGAVSLDTSNVPDTSNKRYVTDANLVVIGNTSGVNTGDNATNSQYSGLAASKEDTSNKVATFTGNETSTTKFPVVKAIIDYFTSTQIKSILGISTLSGSNTGDETTSTLGATINGASAAVPNDTDLVATVDTSVVKKITWTNVKAFLKTYFDTIYTTTSAVATQITTALSGYLTSSTAASTYAPIASPTFTGTVTTPAIVVSSETASTIASFDASKNIKSLATTTYPNLTELSYVKGVTSSIQTQLNGKASTLSGTINQIAYFDSASTISSLTTATYPSLTELSYVKGVTSAIQTQINTITGAATTQSRLRSAATSLTNNTTANVTATALTLGAGTWDISAMVGFLTGTTPTTTQLKGAISQTSATLPATDTESVPNSNGEVTTTLSYAAAGTALTSTSVTGLSIPTYRVVLAGSTTFYLVARALFSTSTITAFGSISATQVK